MPSKVAIMGFGPSAIYAIMACNSADVIPDVIANGPTISAAGAFYYHWLPNGARDAVGTTERIHYKYAGTAAEYVRKQWGDSTLASSFGKYEDIVLGFSPAKVFDAVCKVHTFKPILHKGVKISDEVVLFSCINYDIVLCTFALKELREINRHIFMRRPVTIEDCSESDNIIEYNGLVGDTWCRRSQLFGKLYTEYIKFTDIPSGTTITTVPDLDPRIPAISMPNLPDNLFFVGRHAQLDRTLLAHDAYARVQEIVQNAK
jgi:hypothetical protein